METRAIEQRAKEDWTKIAGEEIEIQFIKGFLYAFGSELATLRLFKAMHSAKGSRQNKANDGRFYFVIETNL